MSDNLKEREAFEAFLLGNYGKVYSKEDVDRFIEHGHVSWLTWKGRAALAQAQSCVPAAPPFGSKRNAALALYRPPFKFLHGYIYDADGKMCADEGAMPEHVAARVRGWGRIGYMPDAEALQDEVGQVIAEALTSFWLAASPQPQPVRPNDRCPNCDDIGDVHSIDGEWRGVCHCPAGQAIKTQPRQLTIRELADVTYPWADVWTDKSFGIANAAIAKFCEVNGIPAPAQPKD